MGSHTEKDLYKLLGVDPFASQEEIKKAFRKLAREKHPDKNPQNVESRLHFESISKAYKTLTDPDKRAAYDRTWVRPKETHHAVSWKNALGAFMHQLKDNAGPWPKRGKDLLYNLHINVLDALYGGRFEIQKLGVSVDLPAGITSGDKLRLARFGESGQAGGPPGDLMVIVHIENHPYLSRQGDDLICMRPIPFTIASLGGRIQVPASGGTACITIPPGSKTGDTFRLPGRGFDSQKNKTRGDLVIEIQPEPPKDMTDATTKLLEAFAHAAQRHNFPETRRFETMMHTWSVTRVDPSDKT